MPYRKKVLMHIIRLGALALLLAFSACAPPRAPMPPAPTVTPSQETQRLCAVARERMHAAYAKRGKSHVDAESHFMRWRTKLVSKGYTPSYTCKFIAQSYLRPPWTPTRKPCDVARERLFAAYAKKGKTPVDAALKFAQLLTALTDYGYTPSYTCHLITQSYLLLPSREKAHVYDHLTFMEQLKCKWSFGDLYERLPDPKTDKDTAWKNWRRTVAENVTDFRAACTELELKVGNPPAL